MSQGSSEPKTYIAVKCEACFSLNRSFYFNWIVNFLNSQKLSVAFFYAPTDCKRENLIPSIKTRNQFFSCLQSNLIEFAPRSRLLLQNPQIRLRLAAKKSKLSKINNKTYRAPFQIIKFSWTLSAVLCIQTNQPISVPQRSLVSILSARWQITRDISIKFRHKGWQEGSIMASKHAFLRWQMHSERKMPSPEWESDRHFIRCYATGVYTYIT